MPDPIKKYKAPNGKIVAEADLKDKYGNKFDSLVSGGTFSEIKEPIYKTPNGSYEVESVLKNKYGDKFNSLIENNTFELDSTSKKKNQTDSDSTVQNQKLVSDQEAENGLSATPKDEPIKLPGNKDYTERNEVYKDNTAVNTIKPKDTTLSEAPIYEQKPLTEKEQIESSIRKQRIDDARIGFKEAVTFTDEDKKEVEQRIKDEETIGFWDDAKQLLTSTANIIKQVGTFGLGDTIKNPTKIPFQSEIKEVKKEALKNKEQLDESEIKERAKNLYKEKQEDFIYTDKATKFLEDLPTETKSVLKIESSNVIDNLSSDNKKRMQVNSALEINLKENTTELKRLEQDFRNNPDFTQEDVDNYNKLRETTINTANQVNKNYEHLIKNQEDLLSADKEYDLFKRNYDSAFLTNTLLTTADLGVGMVDFGNYLANTASEINPLNKSIISSFGGNPENLIDTKDTRDDLKAERELIRKPTESVESVNGFVNYMSDLVANQLPVLAVTSTGAGGLVVLGSSSTGQKYAEMSDEKNSTKTPANYTPLQMIGAPLLHGTAEAIFELPTLSILKKGKRVLNAALKETPGLFKQSAKEKAKDLFKDFIKENLSEQATNLVQNANNIYGLGKEGHITDNALDILKDTSALTGILQVTPHLAGAVLKPFQSKDQLKTLEVNAAKMLALSKQLETPNITDTEKTSYRISNY
ncbi:hypothetical protein [Thalassobellus suaedae]|uniref:Uncharacterized protein n=1 Tax=Thalassobellus suaedae TaxID=3074124 RepID=A0ABY9XVP8_9FLAO|nr:hypothetical protein RHP51_04815 [Flavobacteriaceae bacterium HL-DH14]